MRVFPRLAAAAGLASIAIAVAAPAEAHTSLTDATPAEDAKVPSPPRITLTFAEPVKFPGVVLLDAKGGHHESGKALAAGTKVTEQVAGALPPGVYTVGWRVVATDGHPLTGDYKFTVTGTPSQTPAASTSTSPAPAAPAAAPATSPAAKRAASGGSSGSGWLWVGLGAVVVAAVAGGVAVARRR